MAFRKKYKNIIDGFDPDIIVVQECEEPDRLRSEINSHYEIFWVGDNKNKGLSIISKRNLEIKPLLIEHTNIRYMLPVETNNGLKVIAFWAMDDKRNYLQRYIGQVWLGLNKCLEHLDEKTVIVGDLNWNIIWDYSISMPLYGKLTDIITLLKKYRIESIYHYLQNKEFGKETEPTFYLYRKKDKYYHTDYIFTSISILKQIKQFSIGKYDEWIRYSDHMPLFIDF